MYSTCDKICVVNGVSFYFNGAGKKDLYYMLKRRYPVIKNISYVPFIEHTEMNFKTIYANGLCVSIFLKNMGWHLGVIGNIHNYECLIYIFTGNLKVVLQLYLINTISLLV